MSDKLETFLNEAIGLKYGITPLKLSKKKTQLFKEDDQNKLVRSDRTFFCSELVAKAFKCMGVLENNNKSCA